MENSARMHHLKYDVEQLEEAEEIIRENLYKEPQDKKEERKEGRLLNFIAAQYFEGNGVLEDKKKAVELYLEATSLGYYQAASNLGYCYYYGNGVKKDMRKAYHAFRTGADLGSTECVIKLADMYLNGDYVSKDEKHAKYLYEQVYKDLNNINAEEDRAYQQAFSSVCLRLAKCYLFGKGTSRDLTKAEDLLNTASKFYHLRKEWNDYYCKSGLLEVFKLKQILKDMRKKVVN